MRDTSDSRSLFSGGPLQSFASCIRVAHAFGLIDDQMREDFDVIKDIRNHFAHMAYLTTFQDEEPTQFCRRLSTHSLSPEPRLQFLFAVSRSVARLHKTMLGREKNRKQKIPIPH